jgi:hypothetical protein
MRTKILWLKNQSIMPGTYRRSAVMLLFFLFKLCLCCAQQACPVGNATDLQVCEKNKVFAGTQTDIGFTYTWFRNADLVEGPLSGNGGSISFGFEVYDSELAGQYTIEKRAEDGTVVCVFNTNVVLVPLPVVPAFTGGGILCNGQRTMSLSSSETDVSYQLIRNGNSNVGSAVTGTGSAMILGTAFIPGTYTVRAQKTGCSGNSFIIFGNEIVTATPAPLINYSTTNSANLTWPGSGNYIIEYGLPGFVPGTGATAGTNGTVINTPSQNYTITGLAAGTRYAVYVRQACGTGNFTSNSAVTSFSTDCTTISSFPYTEGFETGTASLLPVCIKALDYNADGIIDAGIQSINTRTGTRCGFLDGPDLMVLPKMTLSGSRRLRYFAKATGSPAVCKVWLSSSDNALSSFTTLLLTDTVITGYYLEKMVDLDAYSGNIYLAFEGSAGGIILLDDIRVETIPSCVGPSFVSPVRANNTNLSISWKGTGNFILEYGLAGFTPGTGSNAGTGGTVISNAISTARINSLSPATAYDIYIRQDCGAGSYSSNSSKLTMNTFVGCGAASILAECANTTASFTAGNGVVDFEGPYPDYSTGFLAPGKEIIYSFTPSSTGVYYIETASGAGSAINYYYKVSGNCNDNNWIAVGRIPYGNKTPVGMLTGGTTYYLLLDRESTTAGAQVFKICRANVLAPAALNRCIGTIPLNTKIPAFSSKEEYVLDSAANVIAALDFSECDKTPGTVSISYFVNNSAVRRDNSNREYLNRSLTISSTENITGPVKVKMFFTNTELQTLANEPNDGIADATDAASLNITQSIQACGSSAVSGATSFILQQSNTAYDPAGAYISFISPGLALYYLHAGNAALYQQQDTAVICPGSNTSFSIKNAGAGYSYRWQVNSGSGYVDMQDDAVYSGSATTMLTLLSPPDSYYGYIYRCVATNGAVTVNSPAQFLRFQVLWNGNTDNEFLNPANYSCGIAPNQNIDVVIPSAATRFPAIRYSCSCRSLRMQPGSTIDIRPGVAVNVSGN